MLTDSFDRQNEICLCRICKNDYIAAGFFLKKIQVYQIEMDICTRCNHRKGYDYICIKHTPRAKRSSAV